ENGVSGKHAGLVHYGPNRMVRNGPWSWSVADHMVRVRTGPNHMAQISPVHTEPGFWSGSGYPAQIRVRNRIW
ncbi:Hypothetical predicted protein, partial [Olea europaea subsp. europaea]